MINFSRNKGFTLIEMIVYVAILSIVFVLIINTLLIITRSYKSIKLTNDINNSASISLERIIREVRAAESVNTSSSILGSNPGKLVLNTTNNLGAPLVLDFYVENNSLKLNKNAVLSGVLTKDNVEVTGLIFRHITSSSSQAVKIELTLTGTERNTTKIDSFYSTAVLRGSY
ncbi:MAG TPA: type II secretion system protein [Candidatus Paceibacterota bacterium]|jgi:prepilin-type N-terminal cleavage/methylation domain-containing protein|nr:hypothetical protein [Parcubacteria group bacterium]MDP6119356.1 type II secretion system protein [Candidatus Paceibacterota bacterium]HJN62668.1 type II secretion system protein [Candidatus Paceibacterota bacterium]|tara:strand:+ start:6039 stop:6554 length:516 start_codon:yes stop_codon:yes gene_type:complete